MFKTASELLQNGKIDKETFDLLDAEFTAKVSELNAESKALRIEKENIAKSYNDTIKVKGDLESQIAKIDERIEAAKNDGKKEIVTQLEAERLEKKTLQDNLGKLQEANNRLRLDSEVAAELAKYDVVKDDRELVNHYLRSQVSINEDKIVFGDGAQLSEGFAKYFETNKTRLNPVNAGQGSGAGGSGAGGQGTMKRADFDRLDPVAKAGAMKSGTKIQD